MIDVNSGIVDCKVCGRHHTNTYACCSFCGARVTWVKYGAHVQAHRDAGFAARRVASRPAAVVLADWQMEYADGAPDAAASAPESERQANAESEGEAN